MNAAAVRIVALVCALIAVPSFAVAAEVSASTIPPSTAASADLDATLETFVGDANGGAVALVIRDGVTTTAAAGVANSAGDPMTPEAAFRVGSITKPFVATVVLQLVDEGRVDLAEPLETYLPDTPIGADVTVGDLLRHRSGLPNYTEAPDFFADALADRTAVFTPDEVLSYVEGMPVGEPGQAFAYSNTNYLLLGQLVEEVEGTDLDTVLRTRVTEPLGLEVTHLDVAGAPPIDGLVGGWSGGVLQGDPAAEYDSIASGAWAAGALVSTAGELHSFLDGLFGGTLLSEEALDEMTDGGTDGYGLGLVVIDLESGTRLYGHDGAIPGYNSGMAIEPTTGDAVVVLTNNETLAPFEVAEQLVADW